MVDARFSDTALIKLRSDFDTYQELNDKRWSLLVEMVEHNTQTTERLAVAIEKQAANTAGVVQLYADLQAATRLGIVVRRAVIGAASFGAAVAAIAAAFKWFVSSVPPPGP